MNNTYTSSVSLSMFKISDTPQVINHLRKGDRLYLDVEEENSLINYFGITAVETDTFEIISPFESKIISKDQLLKENWLFCKIPDCYRKGLGLYD